MAKKNQSSRLTKQHRENHGVIGIFGTEAKEHDKATGFIQHAVLYELKKLSNEID